ncbi:MAG TPA: tetratricopeptide repeat protein [Hyphomicrobiales bacterium]|nr:tetratricopeptide repeat protein [Hyphomicrobiales bacterium]
MNPSIQRSLDQAGLLLRAFDFEHAQALYRAVLDHMPNNAAALLGQALILNRSGRNRDALGLLQRLWHLLDHDPGQSPTLRAATRGEVLAQMGLAQQILGNPLRALRCYRSALNYHPNSHLERRIDQLEEEQTGVNPTEAGIANAHEAWQQGHLNQAAHAFQQVLVRYPDTPAALYGLGELHRLQGKLDTAQPLLQQAIIMAPTTPVHQNALGMLLQQRGEVDRARWFYECALQLNPRYPEAHCNLGFACRLLDRCDEALLHYRTALKLRTRFPEALNNLGNLLRVMGRYQEARQTLDQALKQRPDYPDAQHNLEILMATLEEIDQPDERKPRTATRKRGKTRGEASAAP